MQVKVKIHESAVKKVRLGQKAEIRVDAFPGGILKGTVDKVATLADFRGFWDQRGVKEYETIIKIDEVPPDSGLKPGMTAEVRILSDHLPDVMFVPVQAVAEDEGAHFSYVLIGKTIERRAVSIGANNEKFVEIQQGLKEGELVLLDARARMDAETNGRKETGVTPNRHESATPSRPPVPPT